MEAAVAYSTQLTGAPQWASHHPQERERTRQRGGTASTRVRKRRKGGTVEELKDIDSGPKGRQNPLSNVHISEDNTPYGVLNANKFN